MTKYVIMSRKYFIRKRILMPKFTLDNTLPKNLPLLFKERAKANPDVGLQASKDKDGKFRELHIEKALKDYKNIS